MSTKTVATQTHTEHHSWNSKSTTTRTNLILSSFLGALAWRPQKQSQQPATSNVRRPLDSFSFSFASLLDTAFCCHDIFLILGEKEKQRERKKGRKNDRHIPLWKLDWLLVLTALTTLFASWRLIVQIPTGSFSWILLFFCSLRCLAANLHQSS